MANAPAEVVKQRLYSLDIARGIMAVSVFLTHAGSCAPQLSITHLLIGFLLNVQHYFLWCNHGVHWGVVAFVVLSGFCIHMPTAKRGAKKVILPYYARRRFYRIFPVLCAASCLGLVALYITHRLQGIHFLHALYNLSLVSGFISLPDPPGNILLLTVIVECLLYAIYPFAIPKSKKQWGGVLSGALIIYFLNSAILLYLKVDSTWVENDLFAFAIFWWIGAFFAEITFNRSEWANFISPNARVAAVGYAVYFVIGNGIVLRGAHIFKSLLLAVVVGYLLFWVVSSETKNRGRIRGVRLLGFMAAIGERSYSLYLVHLPVLAIFRYFVKGTSISGTSELDVITLLVVMAGTAIFYSLVEKPWHDYAKAASNKALGRLALA